MPAGFKLNPRYVAPFDCAAPGQLNSSNTPLLAAVQSGVEHVWRAGEKEENESQAHFPRSMRVRVATQARKTVADILKRADVLGAEDDSRVFECTEEVTQSSDCSNHCVMCAKVLEEHRPVS